MGIDETLAHLRRMEEARRQAGLARGASVRAQLGEAAATLRQAGARRIVLFGSIAQGNARAGSDVDLAVEGLSRERLFEMQADLMALFRVPVDLVRLEDAPPSLRSRIEAEGEQL